MAGGAASLRRLGLSDPRGYPLIEAMDPLDRLDFFFLNFLIVFVVGFRLVLTDRTFPPFTVLHFHL